MKRSRVELCECVCHLLIAFAVCAETQTYTTQTEVIIFPVRAFYVLSQPKCDKSIQFVVEQHW